MEKDVFDDWKKKQEERKEQLREDAAKLKGKNEQELAYDALRLEAERQRKWAEENPIDPEKKEKIINILQKYAMVAEVNYHPLKRVAFN